MRIMMSSVDPSPVPVPNVVCHLLTTLNLTVALWGDNSTFSLAVTNEMVFVVPVVHFDSTVDLRNYSRTVIVLALGSPSSIISVPYFYPVPKRRVLFLTNSFDNDVAVQGSHWVEQLKTYKHTRFVWLNVMSTTLKMYTIDYEGSLRAIDPEEMNTLFEDRKLQKIPNFHGREITVTVSNFSVYAHVTPGKETNYTDGIHGIVFDHACRTMNLKPKYLMNKGFGSFLNGTFTPGMQRDVMEMKIEVLVGGAYFKPGAMGLIEMNEPWGFICVRYLVPRPKELHSVRLVMMNVFSPAIWLVTLGTVLMVTGILHLIAKYSSNAAFKNYCNVANSFLMVVSQFIQMKHPSRWEYVGSFLPLLLSWGWLGFFMTTAFNSELAASFTQPRYLTKIQTEAQFVEQGFTWGTQESDEWWLLFDEDNPTIHTWVYEHQVVEKPGDRVRKLRNGENYIMLGFTYRGVFFYRDRDKPPDDLIYSYEIADNCIKQTYSGTMFPPGSPYLKALNLIVSRLLAAGIIQKKEHEMMHNRPLINSLVPRGVTNMSKDIRVTAAYSKQSLSMFYEVFYVLLFGHTIATAVFINELVTNIIQKRRHLKNRKVEMSHFPYTN